MKYSDITKTVQATANMDSREQAEAAIRAALETLSERIVGDEAKDLAAQLPEEMGAYLRGREGETGEHFSLQEFYRRVSNREGVDGQTAATHTRAVFSVIGKAVTTGEFADIKSNLSPEYKELFAPMDASEMA
jgi:uncharacterized protein (DUF2267 family)